MIYLGVRGYSITNLAANLKLAHEDESLNSPVDVVYIDLTSQLTIGDTLRESITDDTLVIIKSKKVFEDLALPSYLKDRKVSSYIGDNLEDDSKYNAQCYFLLI